MATGKVEMSLSVTQKGLGRHGVRRHQRLQDLECRWAAGVRVWAAIECVRDLAKGEMRRLDTIGDKRIAQTLQHVTRHRLARVGARRVREAVVLGTVLAR